MHCVVQTCYMFGADGSCQQANDAVRAARPARSVLFQPQLHISTVTERECVFTGSSLMQVSPFGEPAASQAQGPCRLFCKFSSMMT